MRRKNRRRRQHSKNWLYLLIIPIVAILFFFFCGDPKGEKPTALEAPQIAQPTPVPANAKVDAEALTRLTFKVRGSFANSVWRAVMDLYERNPEAGAEENPDIDSYAGYIYHLVDRILQWRFDIQKGYALDDEITILLEPYDDPDRDWAYRIVALDYKGEHGQIRAYYFHEDGRIYGAHYDEKGVEFARHLVDSPVKDWQEITALWGDRRRHKGIDYKVPRFTEIYAPMDGTVTRTNWRTRGNGNCLELVSPDGTKVMKFLHMEKFPDDVVAGMKVKTGDRIGFSGNTGRSYAPHLHFQLEFPDTNLTQEEMKDKGLSKYAVDPFKHLPSKEHAIPQEQMGAFNYRKAKLDALLFPPPPEPEPANPQPIAEESASQN